LNGSLPYHTNKKAVTGIVDARLGSAKKALQLFLLLCESENEKLNKKEFI